VAILFAILAMSLLALLLGVGLGVAAKFFSVPVDPRVEKAIDLLPGANCGGCGFPGCAGFAKAVGSAEAAANLCAPGGAEVAQNLALLFGLDACSGTACVAQVQCRVGADPQWEKYEYDGVPGCGNAKLLLSGVGMCDYGCMGLLDCVEACPFGAVAPNPDPVLPPTVDVTLCTGCGICVDACPNDVIALVPLTRHPVVLCRSHLRGKVAKGCCIVSCIGCGKCVRVCPEKAIQMVDDLPVIDIDLCTACGKCIEGCPTNVIVMFHDTIEPVLAHAAEGDAGEVRSKD
jgi:Na+-translocating ferredoxin:NAD+ oxidoreductase RNF subunit RnfB